MPRYKLTIEYDGSDFFGWQRQKDQISVQEVIEEAVFKFSGERVAVFASGRTDSGVHALGQVASMDLERAFPADKVRDAINFHLRPARVAVLSSEIVDEEFHARFSATERSYLYRIINRRAHLVLDHHRAWFVPQKLDVTAMHEAAQVLVGTHDFTSFRAKECQAQSPVKTMNRIAVSQIGEEIRIELSARSFLYHQVRNIAGSLKKVGIGKWTGEDLKRVLAARDRSVAGEMAPAWGLYFVSVSFDETKQDVGHDPSVGPEPARQ
ncbi:tRNA pseudouridine(38-40) synthase TruA [Kiloniella laminariae]|uniref:tRNA pseudouridine synthase A n=1 Tax=Kiloniella laminariae TaxID=454162 RepID=A0ABT4LNR3_9PROT|nr:tRNA pseudouridine(38-40) synthase TruA [Kiloniella laminariae]MCZ4281592.1 tRNA pseudouridine(38-40) synthase TruA [Kiloniella laminariae]